MADPRALLDPDFVRELEALRRRLQVLVQSGASGERVSRRKGGSAEIGSYKIQFLGTEIRNEPHRVSTIARVATESADLIARSTTDGMFVLRLTTNIATAHLQ